MAEEKMMRLSQVARKLNVGTSTIADHLADKGFKIDNKPNTKITMEQFSMLSKEFASSAMDKEEALGMTIGKKRSDNFVIDNDQDPVKKRDDEEEIFIKNLGNNKEAAEKEKAEEKEAEEEKQKAKEKKEAEEKEKAEKEKVESESHKLKGIKVVGKINLDKKKEEQIAENEKQKEIEAAKKEEKEKQKAKEEQQQIEEKKAKEEKIKEEQAEKQAKEEKIATTKKAESEEEKKAAKKEVPEKDKEVAEEPEENKEATKKEEPEEVIEAKADQLKGLTVVGKIELPEKEKREKKKDKKAQPVASSDDKGDKKKKKRPRKRVRKEGGESRGNQQQQQRPSTNKASASKDRRGSRKKSRAPKEEVSDKEIQEQIKATMAKLTGGKKSGGSGGRSKYKREKRSQVAEAEQQRLQQEQDEAKKLQVNEFISANDLASLMGVSVNEVISTCMSLGLFVSINQRLDAETITVIADEFGYEADFTSNEDDLIVEEEQDKEEDLIERAPIVTIMGHVDHGKTSLLDFIRHAKVAAGEAGGITQHIGAYDVETDSGKRITFLDTPGHEAFTAMRARGASITDVVVIVVAADDNVMPQTKEAINHAQVAGVPIVIAINKIDKPNANAEKIREELANINILVEDWGGKYQCQEISAKSGLGINELLEKVLLEAELLELKANPNKNAIGTVIEASLDKGRGYVATILVQSGSLSIGDVMLAGAHYGKVKAMFDHRGNRNETTGPSTPVLVLGLDGAPPAGDKLNVINSEREARDLANKRSQIQREQNIRTKKHITLDEIGRRLAIGSFKELNIIVKGDVDGSVEALSDSLLKLSTEEVQVNIIHSGVGQISESDVLLASASDAVIVGFQVRPSSSARKLAENEEIEIRLYSVIYDVINEVKDAMEGLLAPSEEEVITGNAEVRDVFKISKIGTVAGCMVTEGFLKRNNQIRLIRDGIVVYTGDINQLKRFKDDVNEVKSGYECGMSIKNFNDIKEGDVIEGFEVKEVKRKL